MPRVIDETPDAAQINWRSLSVGTIFKNAYGTIMVIDTERGKSAVNLSSGNIAANPSTKGATILKRVTLISD